MTSSRLSVADVAGVVPRITARAVLAKFLFFSKKNETALHASQKKVCAACIIFIWRP